MERSLVQPGLELPLLAEPDRVAVAKVIVQAAEDLIAEYEHHENEYDRAYAEKLHKLVGLLNEESHQAPIRRLTPHPHRLLSTPSPEAAQQR